MPHGHAVGVPDDDPERSDWAMKQMQRRDAYDRLHSKIVFCEPCTRASHTACGKVCVRPCQCRHRTEPS